MRTNRTNHPTFLSCSVICRPFRAEALYVRAMVKKYERSRNGSASPRWEHIDYLRVFRPTSEGWHCMFGPRVTATLRMTIVHARRVQLRVLLCFLFVHRCCFCMVSFRMNSFVNLWWAKDVLYSAARLRTSRVWRSSHYFLPQKMMKDGVHDALIHIRMISLLYKITKRAFTAFAHMYRPEPKWIRRAYHLSNC